MCSTGELVKIGSIAIRTLRYYAQRWLNLVDDMFQGQHRLMEKVWNTYLNREAEDLIFYQYVRYITTFIDNACAYVKRERQRKQPSYE